MTDMKARPVEAYMQQFARVKNSIQAILFASGEPMEAGRLALILEEEPETVGKLVELINLDYQDTGGPFRIITLEDRYQLTTSEQFADDIKRALDLRRGAPLSQASLEVLAIVAYNQPVTRAFVEQVRGVDSSHVVNTLVEKGLLGEAGRLEIPGRPISYRTTANFLRCFGMESLDELPVLEEEEGSDAGEDVLEGQLAFGDSKERAE